jgi:hypothetical protein
MMAPDNLMKAYVEARFGTDEAMGIMMKAADGTLYPMDVADIMFVTLGDAMPDVHSVFPDGSSATVCTNYAIHVMRDLGDRVKIYGFPNEQNRNCRVVREQLHPGGHDFALVDERYIVDPWIWLVASACRQICFDLEDETDRVAAADWYGPREFWTRMTGAEDDAQRPQDRPVPLAEPSALSLD